MEEAIFKGVTVIFPNVEQLYRVRHLQKRDEIKISKLIKGKNYDDNQRSRAKRGNSH